MVAFGTSSNVFFAPEVLWWPSAPALIFFWLRRSCGSLRHLLSFLFCSGGPVVAFGTCCHFCFALEVLWWPSAPIVIFVLLRRSCGGLEHLV